MTFWRKILLLLPEGDNNGTQVDILDDLKHCVLTRTGTVVEFDAVIILVEKIEWDGAPADTGTVVRKTPIGCCNLYSK